MNFLTSYIEASHPSFCSRRSSSFCSRRSSQENQFDLGWTGIILSVRSPLLEMPGDIVLVKLLISVGEVGMDAVPMLVVRRSNQSGGRHVY